MADSSSSASGGYGGAIIGAASQIGGGVLTMFGQKNRERRAMRRTKELMDIQQQNQMALDKYGQEIQLDTWKKTSYPAQVAMLKEAGLNPALLYGNGGGGSATTGSQGGGSASSGSYQNPPVIPMEIGAGMQTLAQIELMKAQAKKAEAEANAIEEYGNPKTAAETGNIEANTALTQVRTEIERIGQANRQYQIDAELKNIAEETNKLRLQNKLTTETFNSLVQEAQAKAIGQTLDNELTIAKKQLTNEEQNAIITGITQKWSEISQKGQEIDLKGMEVLIQQFKAELEAENPTIGEIAGNVMKKAYLSLKNFEYYIRGEDRQPLKQTIK